jgi:hypothetical protein
VSLVNAVEVPRRAVSLLEPIIGGTRYAQLAQPLTRSGNC